MSSKKEGVRVDPDRQDSLPIFWSTRYELMITMISSRSVTTHNKVGRSRGDALGACDPWLNLGKPLVVSACSLCCTLAYTWV